MRSTLCQTTPGRTRDQTDLEHDYAAAYRRIQNRRRLDQQSFSSLLVSSIGDVGSSAHTFDSAMQDSQPEKLTKPTLRIANENPSSPAERFMSE